MIKKLISTILLLTLFNGCGMWHAVPYGEPDSKDRQEEKKKKEKRKKAGKRNDRGI